MSVPDPAWSWRLALHAMDLDASGHDTGAAVALDDLTDVTITTPVLANRLRYDGSVWRNSALVWEPMIASDGTVMTDGLLNPMMHEVTY